MEYHDLKSLMFAWLLVMIVFSIFGSVACNPQDDDDDDADVLDDPGFYTQCTDIDISALALVDFDCPACDISTNESSTFGTYYDYEIEKVEIFNLGLTLGDWSDSGVIEVEGTYTATGNVEAGTKFGIELEYNGSSRITECAANQDEIIAGEHFFRILQEYDNIQLADGGFIYDNQITLRIYDSMGNSFHGYTIELMPEGVSAVFP